MSQVIKFLIIAGINCCESKKGKKVTLHDLDLKGSFEWNLYDFSLWQSFLLYNLFLHLTIADHYQNWSKNSIEYKYNVLKKISILDIWQGIKYTLFNASTCCS